ncbi:general secretion pathway protein GspK [Ottowia sp. GY511]|uniref:Type II secretion system protein K n=1 Tax=Ottowia flava TaxID=2675430 RepID=A0ABW4KXX1_9BURK|nr:general secretion pathway protein GspK [Ottowia sp. GY511]
MAMITVALVATLAAAAMWRQWRGVEVEAAERTRVQSAWILTGALDWGRLILAGDLREDRTRGFDADHLGEPWAVPLAEARLSSFLAAGESGNDNDRDAFLSGQVTDMQSRLNVMNLITSSPQDQLTALTRFTRLFELLNLPAGELGALQRGLARADAAMRGQAAEDGADAPLMPRRFEQLAWLGLSHDTLAALRPYVTVLPLLNRQITPVNLNTASAQVIAAAIPDLDMARAQRIVVQRDSAFFRSPAKAMEATGVSGANISWTSTTSDFFEVRGRLRLNDVALEEVSVVQRERATRRVTTLWRERTALTVDLGAGPTPAGLTGPAR